MSRPPSQASTHRSVSRLSQRPQSRLSALRPTQRQPPRLSPLYAQLYAKIVGPRAPTSGRDPALHVASLLDKPDAQATLASAEDIKSRINGVVLRNKVNHRDQLAQAIGHTYSTIESRPAVLLSEPEDIKKFSIPGHLQFLFALSQPPDAETNKLATSLLNPIEPVPMISDLDLWREIMDESPDPLWELGHESEESSSDSESFSTISEPVVPFAPQNPEIQAVRHHSNISEKKLVETSRPPIYALSHRDEYELFVSNQYWSEVDRTTDGTSVWNSGLPADVHLDGAILIRPKHLNSINSAHNSVPIAESNALREVLLVLQGRSTILFTTKTALDKICSRYFIPADTDRTLAHLTRRAQDSLLDRFASVATCAEQLRAWSRWILVCHAPEDICSRVKHLESFRNHRTLRAFAETVWNEVIQFDSWCSEQETHLIEALGGLSSKDFVISLLSLYEDVRRREDGLIIMLELVEHVVTSAAAGPSAMTATILDSICKLYDTRLISRNAASSSLLAKVLRASIGPIRSDLDIWLRLGMSFQNQDSTARLPGAPGVSRLSEEFFIQPLNCSPENPDYWNLAYSISYPSTVPRILRDVAQSVLAAGKARGLLRALGQQERDPWPSQEFIGALDVISDRANVGDTLPTFDDITQCVTEVLVPWCDQVQQRLLSTLDRECGLYLHLDAIENISFMRSSGTLLPFCDAVFARMDQRQSWSDFHWLNAILLDSLVHSKAEEGDWIDPSLLRFTRQSSNSMIEATTVRELHGLQIQYTLPFPLLYIWGHHEANYSEILIFLMQLRRAKRALEEVMLAVRGKKSSSGRVFRPVQVLRSKMSWSVDLLLWFVKSDVIALSSSKFRHSLPTIRNVDTLVTQHRRYLDQVREQSFLTSRTQIVRQHILDLLDLCLQLRVIMLPAFGAAGGQHPDRQRSEGKRRLSYGSSEDEEEKQSDIKCRKSDVDFSLDDSEKIDDLARQFTTSMLKLRRRVDVLIESQDIFEETRDALRSLSSALDCWDSRDS